MKTAVYMRVSSDEQAERGTIQTQRVAAERYLAQGGLTDFEFYADEGVSGTIPLAERPEGSRLLADAREGRIGTVLVYKADRLSRVPLHTHVACETFRALGVELKSVTENFDDTPQGRAMLGMLSVFAGYERDTIIQRSVEGTNRLAREGAWLGGIVPYGYRTDGRRNAARIVVSEEPLPGTDLSEAGVIRLAYRLAAEEGKSCVAIAAHFNAIGIPPAYTKDGRTVDKGKRKEATAGIWRHGRIRNMLISETYRGVHVYGKRAKAKRETIRREVPAIVSAEQWERAQETLRRNLQFAPRNARRVYLLRGLMKCGICGLTFIGKTNKGAGREVVPWYSCNGKHQGRKMLGPDGKRCAAKSIPAWVVEEAIWGDVERFLRNPGDVLNQLQAKLIEGRSQVEELGQDTGRLETALRTKQGERDVVLTLFRKGRIDAASLDRQLDQIHEEEKALRAQIDEARTRVQSVEDEGAHLASAEGLLRALNERLDRPLTTEAKRQLIELLVSRIIVDTVEEEGRTVSNVVAVYRFGSIENRTGRDSWRPPA